MIPKVRKTLLLHSVMMKDLKEQKHLKYRPAAKSHLMKKLHLSIFARQNEILQDKMKPACLQPEEIEPSMLMWLMTKLICSGVFCQR